MWSLDWFAARLLARAGKSVRRVAWGDGKWLAYFECLWWVRETGETWRVVQAEDFSEAEFRARDWTDQSHSANICGGRAAYNDAPPPEAVGWGDTIEMLPRPVPNFPEEAA